MITILAEKPSVAREIAGVLGAKSKRDGYIEGNGYAITWAFGHLVELDEPESYDDSLKRWSLDPLPFIPEKFKLRLNKMKGVSTQFRIIESLFKQSESIICATDAGREGELIFRYIQEKARATKVPAKRLWISSLTSSAIRDGFNNLRPLSDYDSLASAAKCRSEADWIIGLNATRAYTVKYSHGSGVFSVGRVQTPVLAMIVNRDREIARFVSSPFWELKTLYRNATFIHESKRFDSIEPAQIILQKITNQPLTITSVEESDQTIPPPLLFDLTELQRTMNRMTGMSATATLAVAQSLYESKLITYPRTDSRHLSDDIFPQCQSTINKLASAYPQECGGITRVIKLKRFFNSSKVSDHHAIIPTGVLSGSLTGPNKLVYDLIVKSFLAIFYPPCERVKTEVSAVTAEEKFSTSGIREKVAGWKVLYPKEKASEEEQELPAFIVGESGPHNPIIRKSETKPPKYFTEATLLSAMEFCGKEIDDDEIREALKEKGLGTPATRASIIETLVKRDYIRKEKKNLRAQPRGEQLIDLLADQRTLTSPELTGSWEQELHRIARGESDPAKFRSAIREFASAVVSPVKSGSSPLGLGSCPLCGSPVIVGTKGGFGCSSWKLGCMFRFHGEQFGVKLSEEQVQQLLARGRLARPRKLVAPDGTECSGYLAMDSHGNFSILSREEKLEGESFGTCPNCRSSVMEQYKSYSCSGCDLVIWKTIAGKKITPELAKLLLSGKKSSKFTSFKSKAGKKFSACLVIKGDKVEMEF